MPLGISKINTLSRVLSGRTALTATVIGNTQISTAQFKFGSSSALFDGNNDRLTFTSSTLCLSTGDFTIEMWSRFNTLATNNRHLYEQRVGTTAQVVPFIFADTSGRINYHVNGAVRIQSNTSALTTNTWYHIAVSRSGTSTKLFLSGTQVGSTYTDTNNYLDQKITIGARESDGLNCLSGYIDELRVSTTARYTANFTEPSTNFSNDASTVLLLHFEGANASTTFTDDNT